MMRMSKGREVAHESMPRSFFITKKDVDLEVPRMRVGHPWDHPPGALLGVYEEIWENCQGHREVQEG